MAVATAPIKPLNDAPETVVNVLGTYYILAPTEDIEAALKSLTFELEQRKKRGDDA